MRTLLMGAALLACTGTAMADMYRWVDGQGRVHYGDRAPGKAHATTLQRDPRPAPPAPQAKDLAEKPAPGLAEACLQQWSSTLKDPRSAYIVASRLQGEGEGQAMKKRLLVSISGVNGYGGRSQDDLVCPLDSRGQIDPEGVKLVQAMGRLGL